jgi:AraC-like DNA-binding protein
MAPYADCAVLGTDHRAISRGNAPSIWSALLAYFDAHLSEPVALKEMELITGLTSYALIRQCKRAFGLTPHALLIRSRIALAADLLRRGTALAAVAAETGFCDQSHLSRHFRRVYRMSPAEFARNIPPNTALSLPSRTK